MQTVLFSQQLEDGRYLNTYIDANDADRFRAGESVRIVDNFNSDEPAGEVVE